MTFKFFFIWLIISLLLLIGFVYGLLCLLPSNSFTAFGQDGGGVGDLFLQQGRGSFNEQTAPPLVQTMTVIATAYTASADECDEDFCTTASGKDICPPDTPIIASNDLPLNSWVEIEGVKYLVADRMAKKYSGQGRIDILMDTKSEAYIFGRRQISVKILK